MIPSPFMSDVQLNHSPSAGVEYAFTAMINGLVTSGKLPYLATRTLGGLVDWDLLRHVTADALAEVRFPSGSGHWIFELDGAIVRVTLNDVSVDGSSASLYTYVVSRSIADSQSLAFTLTNAIVQVKSVDNRTTPVYFWQASNDGGMSTKQRLLFPEWSEIDRNYPKVTRDFFDGLINLSREDMAQAGHGKLMLLYGPPGTGKTTALRALAKEWSPWSNFHVVMDPEYFFNSPSYMMKLMLNGSSGDDWSLLVLEDCDELIRGDIRGGGQAMSRLLNLTDGFIGQAHNVLIVITTNEDIAKFHPAVTRPGRCLAQLEFDRFPVEEAVEWLQGPLPQTAAPSSSGYTLAELYAIKNGAGPIDNSNFVFNPHSTGLYL